MLKFSKKVKSRYFLPNALRIVLFLVIISSEAFGQSPDIAAMNNYGETPVSLYAGHPQIDVPLGGIAGTHLAINLAANYNPRGIKVEEYGSWIGLGWTVQGGGSISRSIQGVNDFTSNGHLNKPIPSFDNLAGNCENASCSLIESYLDKTQDTQPDIFYFNFGGAAGKFVFNADGEIELLSQAAVQIEPPSAETGEWIITLPNGNKYYFGGTNYLEKSEDDIIGWHLNKIQSLYGEEALFTYESYTYTYQLPPTRTEYYKMSSSSEDNNCLPAFYSSHDREFTIQSQYLSTISIRDWKVSFLTGQRCDLNGASKLDEIQYSYQEKKLKTVRFSYTCNPNTKRLWLESIQEIGLQGLAKPPFRFDYYNASMMPSVNSLAQDHWGYFNGEINENLIPLFNMHDTLYLEGANRDTDLDKIRYGSLERITFPSGGYQEFLFNGHLYQPLQHAIAYRVIERNISVCQGELCVGGSTVSEIPFVLKKTTVLELNYHLIKGLIQSGEGGSVNGPTFVKVEIEGYSEPIEVVLNTNGGILDDVMIVLPKGSYVLKADLDGFPENTPGHKAFLSLKYEDIARDYDVTYLQQGAGLRIEKITTHDGTGDNPPLIKRYGYHLPDNPEQSSGLLMSRPQYYYYLELEDGTTTAYCTYLVRSSNSVNSLTASANGSHVGYTYVVEYEGEEGDPQQGRVVYQYHNASDETGESKNVCSTLPSNQYGNQPLPGLPSIVSESKKGHLFKKRVDRSYQNAYFPVSEEIYEYTETAIEKIGGAIFTGVVANNSLGCSLVRFGTYQVEASFIQLTSQSNTTYDGENNDIGNSFSQTTNYQYSPSYPWLPTAVQNLVGAEEEWVYMSYPQDYDASAMGGTIGSMLNKQLFTPVIDKQYWKKHDNEQKLLRSEVTLFSETGGNLLPSSSFDTELDSPLTTWIPYSGMNAPDPAYYNKSASYQYDSEGKMIEVESEDIPKSIIYESQEGFVLAEVTNARVAEVAFTGFETSFSNGNWEGIDWNTVTDQDSYTGSISYQGNLQKSNLPSGDYTVSLWAKGTSGSISVNGQVKNTNSSWTLYTWQTSPSGGSISVQSTNSSIDDARLHPVLAQMNSYHYSPGVGMNSVSDVNNKPTYFVYDNLHRKVLDKNHKGDVLRRYSYRYEGITGVIDHDEVLINQETLFQVHIADDVPLAGLSFEWDFGDGSALKIGKNVTHTYTKLGMYQVSVNIVGESSRPIVRTINVGGELSASMLLTDLSIHNPVQFSVANNTANPEGTTYTWDFGDGNNGSGINQSHTYERLGTYNIKLIIDHPAYSQRVVEEDLTLIGTLFAGIASGTPINSSQVQSKRYSASTAKNPLDAVYTWDFGNGETKIGSSVNYAYPEGGTFPIRLSVGHPEYATPPYSEIIHNVSYGIPVLDPATLGSNLVVTESTYNIIEVYVSPPTKGKLPITYYWATKEPSSSTWTDSGSTATPSKTFTLTSTTDIRIMAKDALNQNSQWVEKRIPVLIQTGN